jgi:hypothetical protein
MCWDTAGNQTRGTATAALASPCARSTATSLLKTQLAHRMANLIQQDLLGRGAEATAAERLIVAILISVFRVTYGNTALVPHHVEW